MINEPHLPDLDRVLLRTLFPNGTTQGINCYNVTCYRMTTSQLENLVYILSSSGKRSTFPPSMLKVTGPSQRLRPVCILRVCVCVCVCVCVHACVCAYVCVCVGGKGGVCHYTIENLCKICPNLRKLPCDNNSYHYGGKQHQHYACNDSTHICTKVWRGRTSNHILYSSYMCLDATKKL